MNAVSENIHFFDSPLCRKKCSAWRECHCAGLGGGSAVTLRAAGVAVFSLPERNLPADVTLLLAVDSVVQW